MCEALFAAGIASGSYQHFMEVYRPSLHELAAVCSDLDAESQACSAWGHNSKRTTGQATLQMATDSSSDIHNTLLMLQQQLSCKDQLISQLQQQLKDSAELKQQIAVQKKTIRKQERKLAEQATKPVVRDVRIMSLKHQVSGYKNKLTQQDQQNQDQQQQLQQCLQEKMQLHAENARLRSQIARNKQIHESSYQELTQPAWFVDEPADAPSCDADGHHNQDADDQTPDCSVLVVPLVAATACTDKAALHTIKTKSAATTDSEAAAAGTVTYPATPTHSEPQLHRSSSSSSSSSLFSCWWPTAAAAAAPAVMSSSASSGSSSSSAPCQAKPVCWRSLLSKASRTSPCSSKTGKWCSRCYSNSNSNSSHSSNAAGTNSVYSWSVSAQAARDTAAAAALVSPSSALYRWHVDCWW